MSSTVRRLGPTVRSLLVLCAVAATASVSLLAITPAADAASDVARLQRRLSHFTCDPGVADGVVGARTRAATWRFQSANGLARDGIIGPKTRAALLSDGSKRCDRRPVPAHSGSGRRIVISQYQNWVWLVRADGSVARQGGIIDNPSVLGKGRYTSGASCGGAAHIRHHVAKGGSILDYFTRFAPCGIGFHRVPRFPDTGQIHPNWLLGTDAQRSHGCIRVTRSMAAAIWDFTAKPTRVQVV